MDDVNAILNGEIFILREGMNSIANFERNAKREGRRTQRETQKWIIYKTFRVLRLLLSFNYDTVHIMHAPFSMQKERPTSFINWIPWFSRFHVSQEKHLRRTRIFPSGDLFRTCTLICRGTVYTLKFFICSIYSWRAAKFNEGKKEGRRADWHD